MHRVLVAWLALLPALAHAADDDDDPAFARHPASQPTSQPATADADDDDPGLAPTPAPAVVKPAAPKPKTVVIKDPEGEKARFAYRTFLLPEQLRDGTFTQRFHGFALDVYPISWWVRVGLASQLAIQTDLKPVDWYATEGIVVGVQNPKTRFTPYLEGGVHVGLGTRTFYVAEVDKEIDRLTLFWAFQGEVGVDARVWSGYKLTVGFGLQHTSFFATGTSTDPLAVAAATSVTIKLGLGY